MKEVPPIELPAKAKDITATGPAYGSSTSRSHVIKENMSTDYIATLFDQIEANNQNDLQNIKERQYQKKCEDLKKIIWRKIEIWLFDSFRDHGDRLRQKRMNEADQRRDRVDQLFKHMILCTRFMIILKRISRKNRPSRQSPPSKSKSHMALARNLEQPNEQMKSETQQKIAVNNTVDIVQKEEENTPLLSDQVNIGNTEDKDKQILLKSDIININKEQKDLRFYESERESQKQIHSD